MDVRHYYDFMYCCGYITNVSILIYCLLNVKFFVNLLFNRLLRRYHLFFVIYSAVGAMTIMIEAPICCAYIEITKPVAAFAEKRTFFQKAIVYCV